MAHLRHKLAGYAALLQQIIALLQVLGSPVVVGTSPVLLGKAVLQVSLSDPRPCSPLTVSAPR